MHHARWPKPYVPDVRLPAFEADEGETTPEPVDIPLKSVAESGVLAEALRQSREKWVYYTFPKFQPPKEQPPDSMLLIGRCTVEIGPHIFDNIPFYEVSYTVALANAASRKREVPAAANGPPLAEPATRPHWRDATLAACSDAEFVTLSQLFRERKATTKQAERLAELIQHLFSNQHAESSSGSIDRKTFDVVLEFPDDHDYQLLLPPTPAVLRPSKSGAENDLDLLLRLPFDNPEQEDEMEDDQSLFNTDNSEQGRQYYKAKLKLKDCPEAVSSLLLRWLGSDDEIEEYRDVFRYMERSKRHHLDYRLTSGALHQKVQDAALPHPMTLLRDRRR